ncbi:Ig-like domain-containing protein [Lichenibacterium dinghuense]|uniref:Ig-like domain-containing protein n=1 Tax=Lichenibacterium dinghuense TaxID=2895977 RepID=UPI001F271C88|nr:Ig-like domain-containing protein [Lichenibacterium sp. 6Y81]
MAAFEAYDSNGVRQAYVTSTADGSVPFLASRSTGGDAANAAVNGVTLSSDGRYVVFDTRSTGFTTDPVNGHNEVYLRDTQTGTTQLVSKVTGTAMDGNQYGAAIASAGSGAPIVAFTSESTSVTGSPVAQAVQRDMATGATTVISVGSQGAANAAAYLDSISDAAHDRAAFESRATNLGFASGGNDEVYIKDVASGGTSLTLASSMADGRTALAGDNGQASISTDGGTVAFVNSRNGQSEIYVKRNGSGDPILVSLAPDGTAATGINSNPIISADGKYVEFTSTATNLNGGTGGTQVYVADLTGAAPKVTLLSRDASGAPGQGGTSTSGSTTAFGNGTRTAGQAFTSDDATQIYTSAAGSLTGGISGLPEVIAASGAASAAADTTPPVVGAVTVTATPVPSGASGLTGSKSITLSVNATDNIGVAGVEFYSGTSKTPIAPGIIQGDGSYQATVQLPDGIYGPFHAEATDAAGNPGVGTTGNSTLTVDTTPTAPTFDPKVTLTGPRTVTFTGTASDLNGPSSVSLSENGSSIGTPVTTDASGKWTGTATLKAGHHGDIVATATDAAGNLSGQTSSLIDLRLPGKKGSASADYYADGGNTYLGTTDFNRNGSVKDQSTFKQLDDGGFEVDHVAGSAVGAKGLKSYSDIYDSDGNQTEIQRVASGGERTLTGIGGGDTFVFQRGLAQDVVTNFLAKGDAHDTLSFSRSEFSSFADVLASASQVGMDTVITGNHGDKLTLTNVAVGDLSRSDFKFHA